MNGKAVFGTRQFVYPQVRERRVDLLQRTSFTTTDAHLGPGQAIEFEFICNYFPFSTGIVVRRYAPGSSFAKETAQVAQERSATLERLVISGVLDTAAAADTARFRNPMIRWPDAPLVTSPDGPLPPSTPPQQFAELPIELTYLPPGENAPIVSVRPRWNDTGWPFRETIVGSAGRIEVPDASFKGQWRCRIKNISDDGIFVNLTIDSKYAETNLAHRDIPLELINRLSSVALAKAAPKISLRDSFLSVEFDPVIDEVLDLDLGVSLMPPRFVSINSGDFLPNQVKLISLSSLRARLDFRRSAIQTQLEDLLVEAGRIPGDSDVKEGIIRILTDRMNEAASIYKEKLREVDELIGRHLSEKQHWPCLVVGGVFGDEKIKASLIGLPELSVIRIENLLPELYIIFNEQLKPELVISTLKLSLSPLGSLASMISFEAAMATVVAASFSGVGTGLAIVTGLVSLLTAAGSIYAHSFNVEELLGVESKVKAHGSKIGAYLRSYLGRMVDFGAEVTHLKILFDGEQNDSSDFIRAYYCHLSAAHPPKPLTRIGSGGGVGVARPEVLPILASEFTSALKLPITTPAVNLGIPVPSRPIGTIPDDFKVMGSVTSSSLTESELFHRLDAHECIVLLMMENRSFDHMFFELPKAFPNHGFEQAPTGFTNAAPPGFPADIGVNATTTLRLGDDLFIRAGRHLDPSHGHEAVKSQMGDGVLPSTGDMRGFARNFALKSDSPQIVMSYFPIDSLPTYKTLAEHFTTCDRWFCSLPTGTYPNRLSALQGDVSIINNIEFDDPAIGYLRDGNLLDVLTEQNIPWLALESDISTLRLYDRYRLNAKNIRPICELKQLLERPKLPRFLIIEPSFLYGNDDHPPMSVQRGQAFIASVVNEFIKANKMDRTLFAITYDEHGGFFDHVAPPGTAKGPAEWRPDSRTGGLPPVYKGGTSDVPAPRFMGPRVPSMILSPFAKAGANHTILDHTSIVKTVLLHNRSRLRKSQFSLFGERVKMIASLGQALTLSTPRAIDYRSIGLKFDRQLGLPREEDCWAPLQWPALGYGSIADPEHPGKVMHSLLMPRARVLV